MTQEDKALLLKDLCARLPYGVKVQTPVINDEITLTCGDISAYFFNPDNKVFLRPYLRSMSNMTEEELYEVQEILGKGVEIREDFILSVDSSINSFSYLELIAVFDWLNAHHFDYHGLIKKGLAIEAPKGMYN